MQCGGREGEINRNINRSVCSDWLVEDFGHEQFLRFCVGLGGVGWSLGALGDARDPAGKLVAWSRRSSSTEPRVFACLAAWRAFFADQTHQRPPGLASGMGKLSGLFLHRTSLLLRLLLYHSRHSSRFDNRRPSSISFSFPGTSASSLPCFGPCRSWLTFFDKEGSIDN
jgi:hypothetical protein